MLERERSPILGCRAGLGSRLFAQAAHYSSVRFFCSEIPWSLIGAAVTSNQTISCLMPRVMHISLTSMLPFIIRNVGYTLVLLGVWHIWLPKSLEGKDTHGVSTGGVLVSQSTSCCSDDVHLMGAHLRRWPTLSSRILWSFLMMSIRNAAQTAWSSCKQWVLTFVSIRCFSIWSQLLERNVSQRLGCRPHGQGFQDIQTHAWLRDIDWEVLDTKEAQPPFVPDVSIVNCRSILYSPPCRWRKLILT